MYFDDTSKKYIILDIEGNSVSKEEERRITQFAAITFKNGVINECSWMNRNVNMINPYVSRMTRISIHKCKDEGFSERHLIEKIYNLLKDCDVIYAYGCEFDKKILKLMFKKYNLPILTIPWIDILDEVKKYLTPSKFKLSIVADEYGFKSEEYHNALVDCQATLYIMKTIENIERITQ